MAQLAIKGHETRSKEVIEILEMLGGKNKRYLKGTDTNLVYYINLEGNIDTLYTASTKHYKVFTLEEFLERYPYKVGDKVKAWVNGYRGVFDIQDIAWDSIAKEVKYKIRGYWHSAENLQPYKEAQMYLNELANKRTEEIVQALKPAKEIMYRKYNVEEYLKVWKETEKGLEVVVNDRFELKEDNGKFYIIKKPVQYPKTYEACCGIMGISYQAQLSYPNPDAERGNTYLTKEKQLLDSLKRLRICRNAYWKIIGEEMRLGQPWEPDWNNVCDKYTIYTVYGNEIWRDKGQTINTILAFPTAEIRDAFYENFKDLIEECKEFL